MATFVVILDLIGINWGSKVAEASDGASQLYSIHPQNSAKPKNNLVGKINFISFRYMCRAGE